MIVINESELHKFARKHSNARKPLGNWLDVTKAARWLNFADVRPTFDSADYVHDLVIFDIGGNNFRLVSSIDFITQQVFVVELLTHAAYDRWQP